MASAYHHESLSRTLRTAVAIQLALQLSSFALDNGLALTPPMGWNSWNTFQCNINEALIEATADTMVSSGMLAAGYRYVNIDDCWAASSRDGNGNLVADAAKFPDGIKAVADYVHSKGLRLGIYEDRGTAMCQGEPGSQGHETQDAATFASWGIDYLKYDNCSATLDPQTQYTTMSNALVACGRPIVFSICAWGFASWQPAVGNLWRTTGDITDSWGSIMGNLSTNEALSAYARPGAWNDPDMLVVGIGAFSNAENRAHFSMWAMMASPLIAGNDLRSMSAAVKTVLTNQEVIAIDQDSLGVQGVPVRNGQGQQQVWCKPLLDGSKAVALLNTGSAAAPITFSLADISLSNGTQTWVRDLWAHADLGSMNDSMTVTVQSHDVAVFRVTPGPDPVPPGITGVGTNADSSTKVYVSFNKQLDQTSAVTAANYVLDHGLAVTSATLQPTGQMVVLSLSAGLQSGTTYQLTVSNIKNTAGVAMQSASVAFTYNDFPPVTSIRYYPRPGWESRMVGGIFEGTSGNKDAGPYLPFDTIQSTPAANTWTVVSNVHNGGLSFRYVRYRSAPGGYGNVSEIQFYSGTTLLTGAAFGTPGSYNNSGNDFTKAFDGNVNSFFDCSQADSVYAGIDLGQSGATGAQRPTAMAFASASAKASAEMYDLRGKLLYRGRYSSSVAPASHFAMGIVIRKVGNIPAKVSCIN